MIQCIPFYSTWFSGAAPRRASIEIMVRENDNTIKLENVDSDSSRGSSPVRRSQSFRERRRDSPETIYLDSSSENVSRSGSYSESPSNKPMFVDLRENSPKHGCFTKNLDFPPRQGGQPSLAIPEAFVTCGYHSNSVSPSGSRADIDQCHLVVDENISVGQSTVDGSVLLKTLPHLKGVSASQDWTRNNQNGGTTHKRPDSAPLHPNTSKGLRCKITMSHL